jgi:SNF2 family DNA or RNA helicase
VKSVLKSDVEPTSVVLCLQRGQFSTHVSLMNVAMELKKAANHPFLFEGAENRNVTPEEAFKNLVMGSGKMVLLDKLLARLKADGQAKSVDPGALKCSIDLFLASEPIVPSSL